MNVKCSCGGEKFSSGTLERHFDLWCDACGMRLEAPMSMLSSCSACGSDWCSNCDCVRKVMQKKIDALVELINEWRPTQPHDRDCPQSDDPSMYARDLPTLDCVCGAEEWNDKVKKILR